MRQKTVNTILDLFGAAEFKIASAIFAQRIEGTITKKAVEIAVVRHRMTGEIFAIRIAEKSVTVLHTIPQSVRFRLSGDYTIYPIPVSMVVLKRRQKE